MFVLAPLKKWEKGEATINLKCNPERTLELRETYESIYSGPYVSNNHWNTIALHSGEVSSDFLKELIDHSYDMVVQNMTKKMQEELKSF